MSLFNAPVFIKPLGVIVAAEEIKELTIQQTLSREYTLIEGHEPKVTSEIKAVFSVTALIPSYLFKLAKGAKFYNENAVEELAAQAAHEASLKEEAAPKRRGRRARNEEVEAEEVEEYTPEPYNRAFSIGVLEVRYTERQTPLEESEPYRISANKSERNEQFLEEKLAQIAHHRNLIAKTRATLAAPSAESITENAGSLIPSLSDEGKIDRLGLESYEMRLKNKIDLYEEEIRKVNAYFKEQLIDKANAKTREITEPFNRLELKIQDDVTSLDEILAAIKSEVFIPVDL